MSLPSCIFISHFPDELSNKSHTESILIERGVYLAEVIRYFLNAIKVSSLTLWLPLYSYYSSSHHGERKTEPEINGNGRESVAP